MCLHAARLPGRVDLSGDLNPLLEQDRSRWDRTLADEGLALPRPLGDRRGGEARTTSKPPLPPRTTRRPASRRRTGRRSSSRSDRLMEVAPSPVVALNRAIAIIAQIEGPESGLEALHAIPDAGRLSRAPSYPAALGELELRRGNLDAARSHFSSAAALARNPVERRFLSARASVCAPE